MKPHSIHSRAGGTSGVRRALTARPARHRVRARRLLAGLALVPCLQAPLVAQLWYDTRNLPGTTWAERTEEKATVAVARGTNSIYTRDPLGPIDARIPKCNGYSGAPRLDYDNKWVFKPAGPRKLRVDHEHPFVTTLHRGIAYCFDNYSLTAINVHTNTSPGTYPNSLSWYGTDDSDLRGRAVDITVVVLDEAGPLAPELRIRSDVAAVPAGSHRISFTIAADVAPPVDVPVVLEVSATGGVLEPDESTLCLRDSRYRLTAAWWAPGEAGEEPRPASVVHAGTNDSGLFSFFDEDNWEILVKLLDGCQLNGKTWVFASTATDLGYRLRVEDTAATTTAVREYRNEAGFPSEAVADTMAFEGACQNEPAP